MIRSMASIGLPITWLPSSAERVTERRLLAGLGAPSWRSR